MFDYVNDGYLYVEELKKEGTIDKNMFSFMFYNEDWGDEASYIDFGSHDSKSFKTPTYVKNVDTGYWSFEMMKMISGSKTIKSNIDVYIESATSFSYIPEKYWDDFIAGIGGDW